MTSLSRTFAVLCVVQIFRLCAFAPHHQVSCPICHSVTDLHSCVYRTCHGGHVCEGLVDNWKFFGQCISNMYHCHVDEYRNSYTCRENGPFGPKDHCVFCCDNNDCVSQMIQRVQHGINSASAVIHCPVCNGVVDPMECINNTMACPAHSDTCSITINNGLYSTQCGVQANCSSRPHAICCHNDDCINKYLTPLKTTEKTTKVTATTITQNMTTSVTTLDTDSTTSGMTYKTDSVSNTQPPKTTEKPNDMTTTDASFTPTDDISTMDMNPTTTAPPMSTTPKAECKDAGTFPCHVGNEICNDTNMAERFCAKTCGSCQEKTTSCQVCGDTNLGVSCSPIQVVLGNTTRCADGLSFCMTDYYHNADGTEEIYKRCVDEATCMQKWYKETSDNDACIHGNLAIRGDDLTCHFCCKGSNCNTSIRPEITKLYKP